MDGVLLINKERDWTSRDVCNKIQKIMHTKSVGHTGTLDPFATGLLVVTINKANKIMQFTDDFKKTYVAKLKLGMKTDTGDLTGKIIKEEDVKKYSLKEIEDVLNSFLGKIKQIPPMTSAVHHEGRKLYEIYHDGIEVEREAREIEIYSIKLLDYRDDIITFETCASKGTYIRVLGEDIAEKLKTVGHLIELERTKVGDLSLDKAIKIDEVKEDSPLISISEVLTHFEKVMVSGEDKRMVLNGMTVKLEAKNDMVLIVDESNSSLAVYSRVNNRGYYHCYRGLW